MAPASKSNAPTTSKTSQRQAKFEDVQNTLGSPSSKSHSSSRTGGGRSHRSHRTSNTAKSSLRETLSSFGDDVIKVKGYPGLYAFENHGYFQPETLDPSANIGQGDASSTAAPYGSSSLSVEKGAVESELAIIMSHDPNFQTKKFEKVNPSEVGKKSSKWQKLVQASISSRKFQKLKSQIGRKEDGDDDSYDSYLEEFYKNDDKIDFYPPFWGVSDKSRDKISFLSLCLILHELACFTSCVLLGCTIFQGMESISWVQQKPFVENWTFFKWYSSFQTILVVITCLGFLNRVDTTEFRSLWVLPLFLIPVLGLSISDYCNKAWELQRLECLSYYRLDDIAKQKVHLSQSCSPIVLITPMLTSDNSQIHDATEKVHVKMHSDLSNLTELDVRGIAPVVMRILATLSTLVISLYLFCCRKSFFLIDLFGPPKNFSEIIELTLMRRSSNKEFQSRPNFHEQSRNGYCKLQGNEPEQDVKVIFKRDDKNGYICN